jgi:hypothetical protein
MNSNGDVTEEDVRRGGALADRIWQLEEENDRLKAALKDAFVVEGRNIYFRSGNGIPMGIRPKLEKLVRAALADRV